MPEVRGKVQANFLGIDDLLHAQDEMAPLLPEQELSLVLVELRQLSLLRFAEELVLKVFIVWTPLPREAALSEVDQAIDE